MFDLENPPEDYKKFTKAIKKTLEAAEIEDDDDFDTALFVVNRDKEGQIYYAYEVWERAEGKIEPEQILYQVFPTLIRNFNSKYYAVALPAARPSGEDILILISGDINVTDVLIADVEKEDGYLALDSWEKRSFEEFPEITQALRHSITLQG